MPAPWATPTWSYPYAVARRLVDGAEPIETGDELGLTWRGELHPPLLSPPGTGRRAIVVDVNPLRTVTVALIDGMPPLDV